MPKKEKEKDTEKKRKLSPEELEKVKGGAASPSDLPPTVPENPLDPSIYTNI